MSRGIFVAAKLSCTQPASEELPHFLPEYQDKTKRGTRILLEQRLAPVLQRFLDLVQELMGDGAVHHAVVVAQRYVAHGSDGDGVVYHHRALFNGAEAKNAD